MKTQIFTIVTLFFFGIVGVNAQTWDGGGDGTSWNDPLNWDTDMVPATDSLVLFGQDATITGTMTNIPVQIKIGAHAKVNLNLDLTVGNGVTDEHAFVLNDSCELTLGANTFMVNAPGSKNGFGVFNNSEMVAITLSEGGTLALIGGQIGINLSNSNSTLTNNGLITGGSGVRDGIKIGGTIVNNGSINFTEVGRDGIWLTAGGALNNGTSGTIDISKPGDDCIEVKGDGTFTNDGTLYLIIKDDAGTGENCIGVGTAMEAGTFVNNSANVTLDGGADTLGRAIFINDLGIMSNNGTITLNGGDEGSRLFVKGVATNELNAIIDLTDGRFNVNATGTFTNNGLIKTTREGSGGFNAGTATNNAFFDYANSNGFASGMGNTVDNGISLNNTNQTTIDAAGSCTIDIAETAYEWFEEAQSVATADETGSLTLPANSLTADPAVLTTTLEGVTITVQNFCPEALVVSSVFDAASVTQMHLYPSPVVQGGAITLELPEAMQSEAVIFDIYNMAGQRVLSEQTNLGQRRTLELTTLQPGSYIVKSRGTQKQLVGRFVVTH